MTSLDCNNFMYYINMYDDIIATATPKNTIQRDALKNAIDK